MTKDVRVYQESEVAAVYNSLKPIEMGFLLGDWTGGDLDTGHAGTKALKDMRWAGKSFRSTEDVDPIMIYDANDCRVWNKEYGHAVVSGLSLRRPDHFLTSASFEKSNFAVLPQQL